MVARIRGNHRVYLSSTFIFYRSGMRFDVADADRGPDMVSLKNPSHKIECASFLFDSSTAHVEELCLIYLAYGRPVRTLYVIIINF